MVALSSGLPAQQSAIVGVESGVMELSHSVAVPQLEDDMVIIRNAAAALNPVDIKLLVPFVPRNLVPTGAIGGLDFAGHVVALGSNVTTAVPLCVGDRVCGVIQGLNKLTPSMGAYAEYVGCWDICLLKIPPHLTVEEAATLPCGIATAGLALYHSLNVPGHPLKPASEPRDVLVYGGSTSSGTLCLQFLKMSGLNAITTCSPRNFDMVKSYGASKCFDYRSPTCIQEIKAYTRNTLKYVVDCVSEPETMEFCYQCIGRAGGKLTVLDAPPRYLHTKPKTIQLDWVLVQDGKANGWPPPMEREADPEMRAFTLEWMRTVQELLDQQRLRPHPAKVMDGGLKGVLQGLEMLKKKEVSGGKLVYPIP